MCNCKNLCIQRELTPGFTADALHGSATVAATFDLLFCDGCQASLPVDVLFNHGSGGTVCCGTFDNHGSLIGSELFPTKLPLEVVPETPPLLL